MNLSYAASRVGSCCQIRVDVVYECTSESWAKRVHGPQVGRPSEPRSAVENPADFDDSRLETRHRPGVECAHALERLHVGTGDVRERCACFDIGV